MALDQGAIKLKQAILQDAVQICKMARSRVHFYEKKKLLLVLSECIFGKKKQIKKPNKSIRKKNKLIKNLKMLGFNN